MKDALVLMEKVSDCMTSFFIHTGECEYTDPPSVFVDGATGSLDRQPIQPSMPPLLTPKQYASTTSTDDVERLEKKKDDLQNEVSHFILMVCAIMQHLGVEVSGD